NRHSKSLATAILASLVACAAACGGDDGIDSDEEARRAYLGLDLSIEKALNLGIDGFNAASSANIPLQASIGDEAGTIEVSGQVDQGASSNKEMRLYVSLVDYTDGPFFVDEAAEEEIEIIYNTDPAELPYLQLSLRDIPDGTFSGTLTGAYEMLGDIEGTATLELSMSGDIEESGAGGIQRVVGTTQVTGVARSGDGTYEVNIIL
ncbi:MAG TPA: hypothetical protein VKZ63_17700, partial [Kofleriaceae bacterium]|nr:hypothetical protein [Kofleriaceae bacterium]